MHPRPAEAALQAAAPLAALLAPAAEPREGGRSEPIGASWLLSEPSHLVYQSLFADDVLLSGGAAPVSPPPSSPESVRSIEWIPILTSVSTFVAFLGATFLFRHILKDQPSKKDGSTYNSALRACFSDRTVGNEPLLSQTSSSPVDPTPQPLWITALRLVVCITGILVSYILYGVLQENVMTSHFTEGTVLFNETNFIVCTSRLVALVLTAFLMFIQHLFFQSTKVPHTVPLYMYSFSSFSNNMSTQAQYEMLKYLSFPLQAAGSPGFIVVVPVDAGGQLMGSLWASPAQHLAWVLAKSCKVPPVMLFEFIVSRKVYTYIEYSLGVVIVLGAISFQVIGSQLVRLGFCLSTGFSAYQPNGSAIDNLPGEYKALGYGLLVMYIVADSFTSNWQHKIFANYSVDWLQMSWWTNLFSFALSFLGVVASSELSTVIHLMSEDSSLALTIFFLALTVAGNCKTSAALISCYAGFIFYTIKHFGPVVYATIATVCRIIPWAYAPAHACEITAQVLAIILVFTSIFVPLYPKLMRDHKRRKAMLERTEDSSGTLVEKEGSWLCWSIACCEAEQPEPVLNAGAAKAIPKRSGNCLVDAWHLWGRLYSGNKLVRIGVIIAFLSSIQVGKFALTKSVFVQLGVPVCFSFLATLMTLLMLTFAMGLRPRLFSFPVKGDMPLIFLSSVLIAVDLALSYVATQKLPLQVYISIRSLEIVSTTVFESLYVGAMPSFVTMLLVLVLTVSTILYSYVINLETLSSIGIIVAGIETLLAPIKQVVIRVSLRHTSLRMEAEAFIYWAEMLAAIVLCVWALANNEFSTFIEESRHLSPVQGVAVTAAALAGGLRILTQMILLKHASATTSAVAENFAVALIGIVALTAYGGYGDVSTNEFVTQANHVAVHPLLGLNITGLSLMLVTHACFAYYHTLHPNAYANYPPIPGESRQPSAKGTRSLLVPQKLDRDVKERASSDASSVPRGIQPTTDRLADPRAIPPMPSAGEQVQDSHEDLNRSKIM